MNNRPVAKTFEYQKPTAESMVKITDLRQGFSDLLTMIQNTCPGSRERSHAITQLEDAGMWAIKSVVHNQKEEVITPSENTHQAVGSLAEAMEVSAPETTPQPAETTTTH